MAIMPKTTDLLTNAMLQVTLPDLTQGRRSTSIAS